MLALLRKALLPCLVLWLPLACGGGDSSSQQQPSGTITGRERLSWDQPAPNAQELSLYSYVLYVDDLPADLAGVTCSALSGQDPVASCSSPLPPLQNGQHKLELATVATRDGEVAESVRSAPLLVTVAGSGSAASSSLAASAEGLQFRGDAPYVLERVVTGLDRPAALARLPDGRLLIAERGGRIRVADQGGALLPELAAQLPDADTDVNAVVSLSPAPDFEASRHLYVGYATIDARNPPSGRVMRFREADGVFGEPAVILDGLPASLAAPWVAIGPDGALYVGTSAGDAGEATDLGSYAGKILRFGLDGTTPAGNPWAASPIYGFGYRGLHGIGWEGQTGTLWTLETDNAEAVLSQAAAGGPGVPFATLGQAGRARLAYLPASAAGAPAEWRGSLFIAAPDLHCLLRVSGLSSAAAGPTVERLFQHEFGRIGLVLAADDGLYFATSNGAAGGDSRAGDAVYRVRAHVGTSPQRPESP